jgi:acetylornithine deacetylase/succinyl-diaminopimelate desuccinylase-like protein
VPSLVLSIVSVVGLDAWIERFSLLLLGRGAEAKWAAALPWALGGQDGVRFAYTQGDRCTPREPTLNESAIAFAQQNQARFVDELMDLLRIPSISTAPEHAGDTRRAAEFVAAELSRIGMENVQLIETATDAHPGGHPLVYADHLHAAGAPTVLCYGHYDVQPAEPLEEWVSPPFEPQIRDGNVYARGAVDDKGQMWMHVKALEALLAAGEGRLPVNVRVIVEGEEEVGGEGIAAFVRQHPPELAADVALVSDTEMFAAGLPTLCVGLRGMIYTEIEARGARTDLHSGMYGGAAPNPLVALSQIIAALKDADGRILIPGFYDAVAAPSAAELAAWRALPFDEEYYRETEVGSTVLTGAGEGVDAAGAGDDAGGGVRAVQGFRRVTVSGGDHAGGADDPLRRPDRGLDRQRVCTRGDRGDAHGLRQGYGLRARRWVDPDRWGLRPRAEDSYGADGVRVAGRQSARAE